MKQHYIYLTTNNINGMKYIGKHYGELDDAYFGSGKLLKADIAKYGKEHFQKSILYISNDDLENSEKEKQFIALYNAVSNPLFYNIHEGGDGGNTISGWTEEQRIAHSKKLSEQRQCSKNSRYGTHLTEETKNKIRQNRDTSYMQTDEYRNNMSKAVSGCKNGMYGKHHTKESKKLMSEHSKGKTSGEKNGMYGKSKDNAINGKKINMYDENHILIKTFNAKTAALDFLGLKGHVGLDKAIKEKTLYKGYFWSVETK